MVANLTKAEAEKLDRKLAADRAALRREHPHLCEKVTCPNCHRRIVVFSGSRGREEQTFTGDK